MRRAARSALAFVVPLLFLAQPTHALVWPDVPERLERGLSSSDPSTRRAAARELPTLSTERATPLVLKALSDSDVEVRLAAAQSAIRLRAPTATDAALPWLSEPEARLRAAACEIANAIPNPRTVPALARALSDADPQVRNACAGALGSQGSPDAVAPLSGKLDDSTPAIRAEVARALARLGDPRAVVPLVGKVQDSVPEVRQAVVRALGDLGDGRATQSLLLALRDTVNEVKVEALSALGRLRAPEAASAIAPLALERNPTLRQAALQALGHIATPEAVRALIRALGTQEDAAATLERTPVRDALVAAGPPSVTELTALLERPSTPAVATSAAWVLGELRATSSAPQIVSALRKGALPAAAALRALAGAGSADQVPVVLEYVSDPSQSVRDEALRTATQLLDPALPDGRAVEPLAAALRSPRIAPQERAAIATLLGRTGAPRAAVELAGLVGTKESTLRLAAIDALGALGSASAKFSSPVVDDVLVPAVLDEVPSVRLHAAVALAASGGVKARGLLIGKLDGVEIDRHAVLAALGGILERHPDEVASARLFADLPLSAGPERDAIFTSAGRTRLPSAMNALVEAARNGDVDDRRTVAAVLGAHIASPTAVALARSLANDSDAIVRAQAAYTIGTIGDLSLLPTLVALSKTGDPDVAANAAAGIARFSMRFAPSGQAAVTSAACGLLADGRSLVRANALAALSFSHARCGDGQTERKLLTDDPTDVVRSAAARAIRGKTLDADKGALDRCFSHDRSVEVAHVCRSREPERAPRPPRAVTMFIVGEAGAGAKPHAPFVVEYEGGILRSGIADRRGASFDPSAPAGDVSLRRSAAR